MRIKERVHEHRVALPSAEELQARTDGGWRMAAIVWEREVEADELKRRTVNEVVPFGLRVSDDCQHLEEDRVEREIILLALELIVQDFRLSQVASELNHRNYRTREGTSWNAASVFELLPRLIDVGPRIFSSQEWADRRQHLFQVIQQ
jgi:hypothetical protein